MTTSVVRSMDHIRGALAALSAWILMRMFTFLLGPRGAAAVATFPGHTTTLEPDRLCRELEEFRVTLDPLGRVVFRIFHHTMVSVGMEVGRIIPSTDQLRALPEGTLGRGLARHMDESGLHPIHFGSRRNQTHDVLHVLMDASISYPDEGAIQ